MLPPRSINYSPSVFEQVFVWVVLSFSIHPQITKIIMYSKIDSNVRAIDGVREFGDFNSLYVRVL